MEALTNNIYNGYLFIYSLIAIISIIVGLILASARDGSGKDDGTGGGILPDIKNALTPDELAYLSGGRVKLIYSVLLSMFKKEIIYFEGTLIRTRVYPNRENVYKADIIEKKFLPYIGDFVYASEFFKQKFYKLIKDYTDGIHRKLTGMKLIKTDYIAEIRNWVILINLTAGLPAVYLVFLKRPAGVYLGTLSVFAVLASLALFAKLKGITRLGIMYLGSVRNSLGWDREQLMKAKADERKHDEGLDPVLLFAATGFIALKETPLYKFMEIYRYTEHSSMFNPAYNSGIDYSSKDNKTSWGCHGGGCGGGCSSGHHGGSDDGGRAVHHGGEHPGAGHDGGHADGGSDGGNHAGGCGGGHGCGGG